MVFLSIPKEAPRADPHAGCCGSRGRKTPGDPIGPRRLRSAGTNVSKAPLEAVDADPPNIDSERGEGTLVFRGSYRHRPHTRAPPDMVAFILPLVEGHG